MKKNRTLSYVILVTFLVSIIAVSPVNAATVGMVAEWKLDEESGSVASDSSANANDGVLSGGKFGNALYFDGVDDYVEIPNAITMDVSASYTFEAWIYLESSGTSGVWVYRGFFRRGSYGTTASEIEIYTQPYVSGYNGKLTVVHNRAGSFGYRYFTPFPLDTWVHLAVTWDGTTAKAYYNGEEQISTGTSVVDSAVSDKPSYIGHGYKTAFMKGKIDEVRISNIARTSFNLISAPEVDINTVALWHLDESVGTTVFDETLNNNDGTIHGAAWAGPTWVTAHSGNGLKFDGVDDSVEVADDDSLDITDGITIEAWIYPEKTSGYQNIVSKRKGGVANYALRLNGKNVEFYFSKPGTSWSVWATNTAVISSNNWYQILVVYTFGDADSIGIYVEGVSQTGSWIALDEPDITANTYPLHIGFNYAGYPQYFKGIIDEVRIWNVVLEVEIDVNPDTLNLKSNGEWITCYIELSDGFDVNDIDVDSIKLTVDGKEVLVDPAAPTEIGDYDSDGVPDLMVKFDRSELIENVNTIDFENADGKFYDLPTTITGTADGIPFKGTDTIRVRK